MNEKHCCSAFGQLIEKKLVKYAPVTLLRDSALLHSGYYHLGPNNPKGFIFPRCPACGAVVKRNERFQKFINGDSQMADMIEPA